MEVGKVALVLCVIAVSGVSTVSATNVRLRDGMDKMEGRVEVLHERTWGTICDKGWDLEDAAVVCRMLGFPHGAKQALDKSAFGITNGIIWLTQLSCAGDEKNISDCKHLGWGKVGKDDCHSSTTAAVICSPVPVRLVNGKSKFDGRVEVSYKGAWGRVCNDGWGREDAQVVCQMLGFPPDEASLAGPGEFGKGNGKIWLSKVRCAGNETSLENCGHSGWGNSSCEQGEDAAVFCNTVRLVGGGLRGNFRGRVEVNRNGVWGTVCDNNWNLKDATVVCKMLGFSHAIEARGAAYFGKGSGKIWLDELQCTGNESHLDDCTHGGWGVHDCGHAEDAGVLCNTVRLVDGGSKKELEGRVEVYRQGSWGTVCHDKWDVKDATVACKMLGLLNATKALKSVSFDQGKGRIWYNHLKCRGTEKTFQDCDFLDVKGEHGCNHKQDAGVKCTRGTAVDGHWSTWSVWANCSTSCGGGFTKRRRICAKPQYGGLDCMGNNAERRNCSVNECPIDGHWSSWSLWGDCSTSCGDGLQERGRKCSNPTPKYGGMNCTGQNVERKGCKAKECSINGQWSVWTNWTDCSTTCDNGTETRSRSCTNPPPRYGGVNCSDRPPPDNKRHETRNCLVILCPVHGGWNSWSNWTSCSATCGDSNQKRVRSCTNPASKNGGTNCRDLPAPDNKERELKRCELPVCPVNGQWSAWSDWIECSATCGTASKSRIRSCTNPPPKHGGTTCTGRVLQNTACKLSDCEAASVESWTQRLMSSEKGRILAVIIVVVFIFVLLLSYCCCCGCRSGSRSGSRKSRKDDYNYASVW